MKKILHLLKDNKAFNALLNIKQNIVVNSSNSEALLIASAF